MKPLGNMSEQKDKGRKYLREIFEWAVAILVALVIAYFLRGLVFERALVDGSSMNDTLYNGEQLIVFKLGYIFYHPQRSDIVVIEYKPGKYNRYLPLNDPEEIDYVKRVIGVPGDRIDLIKGKVYRNGKLLNEPYVKGLTYSEGFNFPVTIPKNEIMVMGDNREDSSDSREFGLIPYSRVRGKAVLRIMPLKQFGSIYRNLK